MRDKLLEIKKLKVIYSTDGKVVEAVNHIDLEIHKGEALGLIGETGAGKTTTALSILNLIPNPPGKIVEGEICYNGQNLLKLSQKEMRAVRGNKISMIFQDPMTALNPVMTVGDQIAEVIRLHQKMPRNEAYIKAQEMLETVGIPGNRLKDFPHQFSGGMKQRVVIAISLACNPELLIADEPTTALDVTIQEQVLDLMEKLQKEFNTSLLMITHDLGVVAEVCETVAIMYAGEIVEYGTIEQVYNDTKHPYTRGLFDSIPKFHEDVKRLKPIKGQMPNPAHLPVGCNFADRCPDVMPKCRESEPVVIDVGQNHLVKCYKYVDGGDQA
ncbi:MAG: peptide/nickel transport system ATP-binding protein [Clostridiales bacterium]|jgi:peptide/nickel transport system ATP-binding protein|nr:peptide/nickel transport system ATP-binding protein [Clostridiales bacterium]MDN5298993.1 peptide/nickel transport system ATP-binding protein [Clostridiales bacterium]